MACIDRYSKDGSACLLGGEKQEWKQGEQLRNIAVVQRRDDAVLGSGLRRESEKWQIDLAICWQLSSEASTWGNKRNGTSKGCETQQQHFSSSVGWFLITVGRSSGLLLFQASNLLSSNRKLT